MIEIFGSESGFIESDSLRVAREERSSFYIWWVIAVKRWGLAGAQLWSGEVLSEWRRCVMVKWE